MSQYIAGDLLKVKSGIIAHQVNLHGIMGAGIAKALSDTYPSLLPSYSSYCNSDDAKLGEVFMSKINNKLKIANCFSQYEKENSTVIISSFEVGGIKAGPFQYSTYDCYKRKAPSMLGITSYDAVYNCFKAIEDYYPEEEVYVPFLYGCGIAGGNWKIIEAILGEFDFNIVTREIDYLNYYGDILPNRNEYLAMTKL